MRPLTEEERTLVAFIVGGADKVPRDALVEPMMDQQRVGERYIACLLKSQTGADWATLG
jgi:hypothetical protein